MNLERQNIHIVNFTNEGDKAAFIRKVGMLSGVYTVRISRHLRRRSLEQNRYYWGAILPVVCGGIAEAWGEPITVDEAHLLLKSMFLSRPIVNKQTGQEMARVWPSSKALNTDQFSEYIEKISRFAAESLGCVIPSSYETDRSFQ